MMIERWSGLLVRRARAVLVVGLALLLAAGFYAAGVFDELSQGGFSDPGSESQRELAAEMETFGNRSADVVAIYSAPEGSDLTIEDPGFRTAVQEVVADVPAGTTASVLPYYEAGEGSGLVSADGRAAQVVISLAGTTQDDFLEHYELLEPVLVADGLETDVAGAYAVYADVNEITADDLERAELLSLPLVLLLALVIFGSLVAASMPALVGAVALVGALAVVRALTTFTDVSVFAVNVISLLGIGLAIDYALFVVSRFREELAQLPEDDPDAPATAVRRTMSTAGRTVLFSGLIVAASLASLLIFPQTFLRSMGYGGMAAVLVAMLAALTLLPAALLLLGRRIEAGRMPWRRRAAGPLDEGRRWAALARGVMRRPVLVIAVTLVALGLLAAPFLGATWGSVDHRVLPADAPSHVAAEKLDDAFGPEQSTANLLLTGADQDQVAAYTDRVLAEVDAVTTVVPVATEGRTTLLRAAWEGNSQSQTSQDVVRELRTLDPDAGTAMVGGLTADTVDLISSVGAHLPWMALIVVTVMLVLLFLAFGSLVLPVKAVVMNVVSITASFGIVTWIFADGNLADVLGFTPQGFLDATNPILMLAILFGLSMDYEVFLLSRVREQWDRTGSNDLAVVAGVQRTGRIITSAAILLGVVIGAFATSGIVFMKMLGIGMLVALLIDATVVRALLVPATMKLLGRWSWWAPAPMARWWQRNGFREVGPEAPAGGGAAAREPDPEPVGAG